MEIIFTDTALADLNYWKKKNDVKIQNRISKILKDMVEDPFKGIGKPEALKFNLSGYWSRRINNEHRIVYSVEKNKIIVIALRHHY
ncbi:MAG: Txe/YoeB family addiction module toxin [Ginsengibacter sp.]